MTTITPQQTQAAFTEIFETSNPHAAGLELRQGDTADAAYARTAAELNELLETTRTRTGPPTADELAAVRDNDWWYARMAVSDEELSAEMQQARDAYAELATLVLARMEPNSPEVVCLKALIEAQRGPGTEASKQLLAYVDELMQLDRGSHRWNELLAELAVLLGAEFLETQTEAEIAQTELSVKVQMDSAALKEQSTLRTVDAERLSAGLQIGSGVAQTAIAAGGGYNANSAGKAEALGDAPRQAYHKAWSEGAFASGRAAGSFADGTGSAAGASMKTDAAGESREAEELQAFTTQLTAQEKARDAAKQKVIETLRAQLETAQQAEQGQQAVDTAVAQSLAH